MRSNIPCLIPPTAPSPQRPFAVLHRRSGIGSLCILGCLSTVQLGAQQSAAAHAPTAPAQAQALAAQAPTAPAQGPTAQAPIISPQASAAPPATTPFPAGCLESGDGYLRARLGGAIDARIDWPNSGTRCQGEPKDEPHGVRLSFQRASGASPDLLFVFGVTGVREGKAARDTGVNLTVIVQGTHRIYGTLGDSRCTVDSLTQRPLKSRGSYRVEARGFCTQPAHAVRGKDALLVSTFEFAGLVNYRPPQDDAVPQSAHVSR